MHNFVPYITTLLRPSSICNFCLDVALDDIYHLSPQTCLIWQYGTVEMLFRLMGKILGYNLNLYQNETCGVIEQMIYVLARF